MAEAFDVWWSNEKWFVPPSQRDFVGETLMRRAFAAGQAAECQRIEAAPRAWIVFGADGVTPIKVGPEVDTKAWAESENEELGVANGYIATECALVPLSPTPQQESEP